VLSHDEAQELGIVQSGFTARGMVACETDRGEDTVVEMDVECYEESVEFRVHILGLTLSAWLLPVPTPSTSKRTHSSRGRFVVVSPGGADPV
jgi:hypothetical protein